MSSAQCRRGLIGIKSYFDGMLSDLMCWEELGIIAGCRILHYLENPSKRGEVVEERERKGERAWQKGSEGSELEQRIGYGNVGGEVDNKESHFDEACPHPLGSFASFNFNILEVVCVILDIPLGVLMKSPIIYAFHCFL